MKGEHKKSRTYGSRLSKYSKPQKIGLGMVVIGMVILAGLLVVRFSRADTLVEVNKYSQKPPETFRTIDWQRIVIQFKPEVRASIGTNGRFTSPVYDMTELNRAVFDINKSNKAEFLFPKNEADKAEADAAAASGQTAPELDTFFSVFFPVQYNTIEISSHLRKYFQVANAYPGQFRAKPLASPDLTSKQWYAMD